MWENIAGDFAYFEGHSRNISADVRHLLWMLDEVDDAGHLLDELGVAQLRDAPARPTVQDARGEPAKASGSSKGKSLPDTGARPEAKGTGACSVSSEGGGSHSLWLALFAFLPFVRSRRARGQT